MYDLIKRYEEYCCFDDIEMMGFKIFKADGKLRICWLTLPEGVNNKEKNIYLRFLHDVHISQGVLKLFSGCSLPGLFWREYVWEAEIYWILDTSQQYVRYGFKGGCHWIYI